MAFVICWVELTDTIRLRTSFKLAILLGKSRVKSLKLTLAPGAVYSNGIFYLKPHRRPGLNSKLLTNHD